MLHLICEYTGEGWGGGLAQNAPDEAPTQAEPPPSPDTSHRIHIAANDPAFPTKREAAVSLICQAITDIATPLGYTRKGTTWSRETPRGRSVINLQRSRYGFTASINLRFLLPDGSAPENGAFAQGDDIRLAHFHLPSEAPQVEDGDIFYLDVIKNPSTLDLPMYILKTRALPWLEAHHTAIHPKIEDFLPR